ncbi:hypothetical protein Golomagni_07601 [Golovinomyces magnicellulatus]|nr:hypothetical protein Golomagni_07601 [Golovinomyces magnicellulatus]
MNYVNRHGPVVDVKAMRAIVGLLLEVAAGNSNDGITDAKGKVGEDGLRRDGDGPEAVGQVDVGTYRTNKYLQAARLNPSRLPRSKTRTSTKTISPTLRRSAPVNTPDYAIHDANIPNYDIDTNLYRLDEKARKEMASKAGGKGPLNTGTQGIKKSGKK